VFCRDDEVVVFCRDDEVGVVASLV
jgi:hypothetical protein